MENEIVELIPPLYLKVGHNQGCQLAELSARIGKSGRKKHKKRLGRIWLNFYKNLAVTLTCHLATLDVTRV